MVDLTGIEGLNEDQTAKLSALFDSEIGGLKNKVDELIGLPLQHLEDGEGEDQAGGREPACPWVPEPGAAWHPAEDLGQVGRENADGPRF